MCWPCPAATWGECLCKGLWAALWIADSLFACLLMCNAWQGEKELPVPRGGRGVWDRTAVFAPGFLAEHAAGCREWPCAAMLPGFGQLWRDAGQHRLPGHVERVQESRL